ncbi:hypothetical protein ACOJVU_09635 [Mycobacterium sp. THU-M104]
MRLFEVHLGAATSALGEADFVEVRATLVVVHSRLAGGSAPTATATWC